MTSPYSFRSNCSPPALFYIGSKRITVAGFLVALQIIAALFKAFNQEHWAQWCGVSTATVQQHHYWGILTHIFVAQPSLTWALGLVFLYINGNALETLWGRLSFVRFYFVLTIVMPIVEIVAYHAFSNPILSLGVLPTGVNSVDAVHSMVFVALCFALGDQHFFHPSIKLKYVAMLVLLLGLFSILATNDTSALVGYLALAGFTYGYVYFHGRYQSARIPRRQRSFNEREEQRRLLKSSVAKDAFEASYDAKLRPRAELSDEHPAVEKVDAVLEKISRSGMQSLTAAERQMLERASQDLRAKDT